MNKKLKFVLIGDSLVGKTAFLLRLDSGVFVTNTMVTLGKEYKVRKEIIDGKTINVQIWDTAGQQRFRKIVSQFFKGIQGAFIVFDLTNQKSLDLVNYWISELNNNAEQNTPKILIGNKSDMLENGIPETLAVKIQKICQDNQLMFFETSAKTGLNIMESYQTLLEQCIRGKYTLLNLTKQQSIKLNVAELQIKQKKTKCC